MPLSTPEKYFAVFDDTVRRLKVVRMREIHPEPNIVIDLSPYTVTRPTGKVKIALSTEAEPMIKRIPLREGKHLYLWRSPWCMYHEPSSCWITILGSDKSEDIPGDFIYDVSYTFYNPWYKEYKYLHETMIAKVASLEQLSPVTVVRPVPSAPPSRKPPAFVAAIIKRDAIANLMTCSISLENITEKMKTGITPCFHLFEGNSLMQWVALKGFCPTCMGALTQDDCLLL